jgi:phage/conjugal plasmid C-4 type zinc finger TraR family protein
MAGGWAQDGAVNEQIEASINDELARLKARRRPTGESNTHCAECEEPIAAARRAAVPGVKLCIACQSGADQRGQPRGGINRRGSKDSQLK